MIGNPGFHFISISVVAALFAASTCNADDSPWTTKPVRVERGVQSFERLPPAKRIEEMREGEEKRFILRMPAQIAMHNSTRFSARGRTYVLGGVMPVPAKKVCTSDAGTHWPCGRAGSIFSGKLLRRQLLQCATATRNEGETRLSNCSIGNKNVQAEIVTAGQGFAAPENAKLVDLMKKARQARAGVWRDSVCFKAGEGC